LANRLTDDYPFSSYNLSPTDSINTFSINEISSPLSAAQLANKRKFVDVADANLPPAERVRVEAEEDKRRRNTAASARFRVKKKQREQALEKTAKDMTDKAHKLEKKVAELELENKWLKGLITERATGGENITELYSKFLANGGEKAAGAKRDS
jgi:hypothetical protein